MFASPGDAEENEEAVAVQACCVEQAVRCHSNEMPRDGNNVPDSKNCTEGQEHNPVEEACQLPWRCDTWQAEVELKPTWSRAGHYGQQGSHDRDEEEAAEGAPCPGRQGWFHVDCEKLDEGLGQLGEPLRTVRRSKTLARGVAG